MSKRLLAGDVGGTKTLLVLFEEVDGEVCRLREHSYRSRDYPGLIPLVEGFLSGHSVHAAGFGVAGPVHDGHCQTTNLPWSLQLSALQAACRTEHVVLENDLQIAARALPNLSPAALRTLQPGRAKPQGTRTLLGVGTGLGQAILVSTPTGPLALATEGGHADFAATDPFGTELHARLRARHGRVSVERAASGSALSELYHLTVLRGEAPEDPAVTERMQTEDAGAVIGELAVNDADAACVATVRRLAQLVGAEAGNLALKTLPMGGLYVAGGVAARLASFFEERAFLDAFLDKGRMRPTLQDIPVYLVLEQELGILGAVEATRGMGGNSNLERV